MHTNISKLNENKSVLERYISDADNNWQDEVKNSFFSNHVQPIRDNFTRQVDAMGQMVSTVESAEREIESLM